MDRNQQEYLSFSIATDESWKNKRGEYENRTGWHRVYAWRNLSRFDAQIRYREYTEEVNGTTAKHRAAEVHANKIRRLTKAGAPTDPDDQASDE